MKLFKIWFKMYAMLTRDLKRSSRCRRLLRYLQKKNAIAECFMKGNRSIYSSGKLSYHEQCDQIWQNLANLLFGKMLTLLWQICDIIRLIFIVANGQKLKNNLSIWSHWSRGRNYLVFTREMECIEQASFVKIDGLKIA